MRQKHKRQSLSVICGLFGVSRQAYYDAEKHYNKVTISNAIILALVKEFRAKIPMIGTRKLLHLMEPELEKHAISIGRDQLFDLLRYHGLLVRRRKRMVKTTDSQHWLKRYPNLTIGLIVTGPEQLWVSDITYIRTLTGFSYLSLITDAYSRKIVGFELHETLETLGCVRALNIAIQGLKGTSKSVLIHHSDRGVQYCSGDYVSILNGAGIAISMTQSGSPYENALAERVNGILKGEFYAKRMYRNHLEAKSGITEIIKAYNEIRPHSSIDYLTPNNAHEQIGEIATRWKKYPRIKMKKEQVKQA